MNNLAGVKDCDRTIREELERCNIIVVNGPTTNSEVPYSLTGALNKVGQTIFTFNRAWYYWSIRGLVPLSIAEELYSTNVGKKDIRVCGHCGCPHPFEWATRFNEKGQEACNPIEFEKGVAMFKRMDEASGKTDMTDGFKKYFPCPTEDLSKYPAYITSYHIDSELGLYIFVQTLKKHGLID